MAKCRGCGMDMGSTYDQYCGDCNKIRWTTVFIIMAACFSGLFAVFKSNAAMWVLGLMLVFYAWLYNDIARTRRLEREEDGGRQRIADESEDDYSLPDDPADSHINII